MSDVLDLEPIKARLAATTPGEWRWHDEIGGEVPNDGEIWIHGTDKHITTPNDGSLGVTGIYVEEVITETESFIHPVIALSTEEPPEDPDDPEDVDWNQWRGDIHADNLADLEFITSAKMDVAALIAEVERLRVLLRME